MKSQDKKNIQHKHEGMSNGNNWQKYTWNGARKKARQEIIKTKEEQGSEIVK